MSLSLILSCVAMAAASVAVAAASVAAVFATFAVRNATRAQKGFLEAGQRYEHTREQFFRVLETAVDLVSRVDEHDPISPALARWARTARDLIRAHRG